MPKYFGTDGIRGVAGSELSLEQALRIGEMLGDLAARKSGRILIGKDTRLSGDFLEHALAAGAAKQGSDVFLGGILPTGAVSMLVARDNFDYGVVISASHNPYEDNGIKIFDEAGAKLDDDSLTEIEKYMDDLIGLELPKTHELGRIHNYSRALDDYLDHLAEISSPDLSGKRIVVDLANGAAYQSVPKLLERFGAEVIILHDEPDGININVKSGSTHPERLIETVRDLDVDMGLAFDGDADRLIVVSDKGNLLSGDHYLYLLSKALLKKGEKPERIVTTQMANLGLVKKLEELEIEPVLTAVGDKYVFEQMVENNDPIGGEQSGHMIFLEHNNTGDGLLSALKLFEAMEILEQNLDEAASELTIYPQLLVNVRKENPGSIIKDERVLEKAREIDEALDGKGRLLLRASGTEPLVRIMVEAPTEEECEYYARILADFVEENF